MQGGTFTISNGGVYGSLMSTPILNAPQSGILGMHKIQERPMVVGGQIVIRPMMYLALSYDHRIVDGKEAVTFLVRVKEAWRTRSAWCWICRFALPRPGRAPGHFPAFRPDRHRRGRPGQNRVRLPRVHSCPTT